MKNLLCIIASLLILTSCSNDSSNKLNSNSSVLQRVDFFPGTSFENRWIFNTNGFLTEITEANGTLIEKFVYDTNNNVVEDIKYSSGSPTQTYIITYDSSNKITSINGKQYNYNASTNRYYYTLGNESFSCDLNSDGIAIHYLDFFDFSGQSDDLQTEFHFQYNNGNLISMSGSGTNMSEVEINFNYGNVINPLKNATLPVFRIKSILEPNFFNAGLSSNNIKENQSYSSVDPETHSFGILIYPNNKLELLTQENFSNGVFESSLTNSYYYYQGNVLP